MVIAARKRVAAAAYSGGVGVMGARGGGGGDSGWFSSSIFLEQSLEREFTPFFLQLIARVYGGGSLPLL